jgi:hypothetical protein
VFSSLNPGPNALPPYAQPGTANPAPNAGVQPAVPPLNPTGVTWPIPFRGSESSVADPGTFDANLSAQTGVPYPRGIVAPVVTQQ